MEYYGVGYLEGLRNRTNLCKYNIVVRLLTKCPETLSGSLIHCVYKLR